MTEEKRNMGSSGFEEKEEQKIIRLVKERIPGISVGAVKMKKNNGYEREGFEFRVKDSFTGIIIYREDVSAVCGEKCTAEEAADYICSAAEKELRTVFDIGDIRDWKKARHLIYRKVVNYERNRHRLPSLVHRRYLDLAEVYYLRVRIPGKGCGTAEVSVQFLEEWGVPEKELSGWADANMDADGYRIQPVQEVLQEFLSSGEPGIPDSGMYVIANGRKELGAGIMTRPECMKDFMRQIGTDCYILPGSMHELLAYPCGKDMGAEELQQMVAEVNQTAVSPEEFLSDHVYFCHMDTGVVELCSSV